MSVDPTPHGPLCEKHRGSFTSGKFEMLQLHISKGSGTEGSQQKYLRSPFIKSCIRILPLDLLTNSADSKSDM